MVSSASRAVLTSLLISSGVPTAWSSLAVAKMGLSGACKVVTNGDLVFGGACVEDVVMTLVLMLFGMGGGAGSTELRGLKRWRGFQVDALSV